jgi:hypothetical protein
MTPRTLYDKPDWTDAGQADDMDKDMENDDFVGGFEDIEAEVELDLEPDSRPQAFTARQRIEMVREERWLKAMMEDFGDYDDFNFIEDTADAFAREFSH